MDANRMEQVFENLIANAIQHSPAGGRVRVAARPGPPPHAFVEFTVEDEGTGLAEADIKHSSSPSSAAAREERASVCPSCSGSWRPMEGASRPPTEPRGGAVFEIRLPLVKPVR